VCVCVWSVERGYVFQFVEHIFIILRVCAYVVVIRLKFQLNRFIIILWSITDLRYVLVHVVGAKFGGGVAVDGDHYNHVSASRII